MHVVLGVPSLVWICTLVTLARSDNSTTAPVMSPQNAEITSITDSSQSVPLLEVRTEGSSKGSVPRKGADLETDKELDTKNPLLLLLNEAVSDQTVKNSSSKEPVKPRKGVQLVNDTIVPQRNRTVTVKLKPLYVKNSQIIDSFEDKTPLTIGLSVGVALVLLIAVISFWRLREVWAHRQYKRVDFLINGMYADT